MALLSIFLQRKNQRRYRIGLCWCNHLWRCDSFYTMHHLMRLAFTLGEPIFFMVEPALRETNMVSRFRITEGLSQSEKRASRSASAKRASRCASTRFSSSKVARSEPTVARIEPTVARIEPTVARIEPTVARSEPKVSLLESKKPFVARETRSLSSLARTREARSPLLALRETFDDKREIPSVKPGGKAGGYSQRVDCPEARSLLTFYASLLCTQGPERVSFSSLFSILDSPKVSLPSLGSLHQKFRFTRERRDRKGAFPLRKRGHEIGDISRVSELPLFTGIGYYRLDIPPVIESKPVFLIFFEEVE